MLLNFISLVHSAELDLVSHEHLANLTSLPPIARTLVFHKPEACEGYCRVEGTLVLP